MTLPDFETLLQGSAREHGHICAGQVIGVRMAMLGLKLIELDNPRETEDIKKLIVYVEIDRCATDAIAYVTGVRLGRRSLKFKDYGVMAATFINLEAGKAYRIVSTESSRTLAERYAPHIRDKNKQQLEAYRCMPLEVLFNVFEVKVPILRVDFPGPSIVKTTCDHCGAVIRDGKEIHVGSKSLCHYCAGETYYHSPKQITVEEARLDESNQSMLEKKQCQRLLRIEYATPTISSTH